MTTVNIDFHGEALRIEGLYSPEVPAKYYPIDDAYPGDSAEFEIDKVFYKEVDITDLIQVFNDELFSIVKYAFNTSIQTDLFFSIEEACLKELEGQDDTSR